MPAAANISRGENMNNGSNVNWDEKENRLIDILEPVVVAYLYVIAVISPIIGLILGIVLMKKAVLEKNRRLGKNCVTISVILLAVWMLCCIGYIALIVFGSIAQTMPAYY